MPRISLLFFIVALLAGCAGNPGKLDATDAREAAKANSLLAVEYMRKGELELARRRLERAIEQAPDYAEAYNVFAILHERVGDTARAEKDFRKSLKLQPDSSPAHNNYGRFLCAQGRYDEALESFNRAAGNPYYKTPWIPLTNAGTCLSGVPGGDAESYFRKALEKKADYPPALLQMAVLRFAAKNYMGARAFLQRLQDAGAHTPESLWIGVQAEYALRNHKAWGKYALRLKNNYPDSEQSALLQEWENERRNGK